MAPNPATAAAVALAADSGMFDYTRSDAASLVEAVEAVAGTDVDAEQLWRDLHADHVDACEVDVDDDPWSTPRGCEHAVPAAALASLVCPTGPFEHVDGAGWEQRIAGVEGHDTDTVDELAEAVLDCTCGMFTVAVFGDDVVLVWDGSTNPVDFHHVNPDLYDLVGEAAERFCVRA